MENIYISELDKIINDFLLDNNFDCSAKFGSDFAYWYENSEIEYSLLVSERLDNMFKEFAESIGLKINCGNFLLSFFHELGHHNTLDFLDDDLYEESQLIKSNLNSEIDEDCKKYFELYDEIEATKWAISYINNNEEKIKKFAIDIQENLSKGIEA